MIVLGLAGHAGSGKDSVADFLVSHYGFIKFSFSDALYREVAAAFNLPDESLLRDRATKEARTPELELDRCSDMDFRLCVKAHLKGIGSGDPLSPREVLQLWGTEYRRAQDPDYWVKRAHDWMCRMRDMAPYPELRMQAFVNTSVRFKNERDFIRDFDGVRKWDGNVWHLRRDAAAPVHAHESETPLPVLDGEREIFNNYSLEYLYKGVEQLLTTSAAFVRLEPPAQMSEPSSLDELVPVGTRTDIDTYGNPLPGGQYYIMQPDGHNMLCNADGTRSVFDDVDE